MSTPLWENARRALARLFANAEIRDISLTQIGPHPIIKQPTEIGQAQSVPGGLKDWQPLTAILTAPALRAESGSQEASLLPCALVVEGLAGWATQGCQVKSEPLQNVSALVAGDDTNWRLGTSLSMQKARLSVRNPACHLARSLPANLRVAHLRRELWERKPARIGTGLAPLAAIPLCRLRLAVPEAMHKALVAGRKQLSMASGVPLDDLILLGLYPEVPIAAVTRLAVEDSGRSLRFWLKPDSLATLGSQRRVTLVIGRRRSSGQIVQMVL